MAGPVVCTTTLEALDPSGGGDPVEVTTCEGTETTDELIRRRRQYDPDLWVIEIEDREGRHFLTETVNGERGSPEIGG